MPPSLDRNEAFVTLGLVGVIVAGLVVQRLRDQPVRLQPVVQRQAVLPVQAPTPTPLALPAPSAAPLALPPVNRPALPLPAARININRAGPEELERLPGIGPALADRIIRYRQQYGPFRTVDDLDHVSGIGPARLEALRDLIAVQ